MNRVWPVFILFILFLSAVLMIKHQRTASDPRIHADGYDPSYSTWGKEYWKEFDSIVYRWEPYVYWRVKAFSGKYIHVDDNGLRRTWNRSAQTSRTIFIFVYGGSTAWGVGARDDETIPSLLSRRLGEDFGLNVRVVNFGQPGYQSTQDFLTWLLSLRAGQRPDIAIFYEGINDVSAGMLNKKPGLTMFEKAREKEFNLLQPSRRWALIKSFIGRFNPFRKGPQEIKRDTPEEKAAMAAGVLNTYLSNLRLIREIGDDRHIKTLFYWHPFIYGKHRLTPYEKSLLIGVDTRLTAFVCRKIDESKELQKMNDFHNLGHLFDDNPGPIFADYAHLTEHGNDIVAKRISQDVLRLMNTHGERAGLLTSNLQGRFNIPLHSSRE